MSAPANYELDPILLLIAHLVCADGQIHIKEAKALQSLSEKLGSGDATKAALSAILAKSPEAPTVYALAEKVLPGQQIEVLKQLLAMAYIDGYLAPVEESFIQRIASIWNISEEEVERLRLSNVQIQHSQSASETEEGDLSTGAQILKGAESLLSRVLIERLTDIAPESLGRRVRKLQQEILLSGPEYSAAIAKCAKVAQKDYNAADTQLKSARKTLTVLREDLRNVLDQLNSQTSTAKGGKTLGDVVNRLEATRQELDKRTLKEIEHIRAVLKAKHRSLNHFTIAFMGKTKAGKSTLHAIITGEGWDSIGVGMQRTTRYNRVYDWKNIRIIDTPGIGAPGGESDEAIARSVVEESDAICYVVTDDSIQATEFEFMKVLKDRTKPLIILLNVKKNLTDPRRLEHFLENPDRLFPRGENGLDGHINRIKRYAEEYYANSYLDVNPVMLLAAQMARQEKDKKQASKLLEASRIQDFLDSLRVAIIDYGFIRRSHTLTGSTVGSVEKPLAWAKEQASAYHQQAEIIANQRDRLQKEFREALTDTQAELEVKIQTIFAELRRSLDVFATEHWESSAETIQEAWQAKLKQYELTHRLGTAVKEAQANLEQRVKGTLEEIGTEIKLLANFRIDSAKFEHVKQNIFERNKELIGLGGALLGALAFFPPFAPFALFLGGAGAVFGLLASGLRSKHQRQSEAVSHIRAQLAKQLSSNEKKVLEQTQRQIEKYSKTITTAVEDYFKQLSDGLKQIADCLQNAEESLREIAHQLNKAYARRILEFASGKKHEVSHVQREFGIKIQIWPATSDFPKPPFRKSGEELSQILQETIIIH